MRTSGFLILGRGSAAGDASWLARQFTNCINRLARAFLFFAVGEFRVRGISHTYARFRALLRRSAKSTDYVKRRGEGGRVAQRVRMHARNSRENEYVSVHVRE